MYITYYAIIIMLLYKVWDADIVDPTTSNNYVMNVNRGLYIQGHQKELRTISYRVRKKVGYRDASYRI